MPIVDHHKIQREKIRYQSLSAECNTQFYQSTVIIIEDNIQGETKKKQKGTTIRMEENDNNK